MAVRPGPASPLQFDLSCRSGWSIQDLRGRLSFTVLSECLADCLSRSLTDLSLDFVLSIRSVAEPVFIN